MRKVPTCMCVSPFYFVAKVEPSRLLKCIIKALLRFCVFMCTCLHTFALDKMCKTLTYIWTGSSTNGAMCLTELVISKAC